MIARWPLVYDWNGTSECRTARSADGRVVIRMLTRHAVPEAWQCTVIVYGPSIQADERVGWLEIVLDGTFDSVLDRARAAMFAAGVVAEGAEVGGSDGAGLSGRSGAGR